MKNNKVNQIFEMKITNKDLFLETSEPPNEQLEEEWQNEVSEKLSRLLQGLEETNISKSDVCPFDALSEVPVDDQRFDIICFFWNMV